VSIVVICTYFIIYTGLDPINSHSFDFTTQEGLLDLVTLGNIVSLSHLLDSRSGLGQGLLQGANAERLCAQADFFEFQDAFSKKFFLMFNGKKTHAQHGLFDPFILQLLVTIAKYKKMMGSTFDAAFSFKTLYDGSLKYLRKYHPHLEQAFIQDMKKEKKDLPYIHSFEWLKPFTVVAGAYQDQNTEMDDIGNNSSDVDMEGKSNILYNN